MSETPAAGPSGQHPGPDQGPPPLTAFAWRNGLVRPVNGRLIAGVSGALGRATNTDPVLWRVVLAVLALFGGLGLLIYVLGWILLPAEGDTAAPIEALLGRGQSRTSSLLTVVLGVIVLTSVGASFSEPFRPGLVGAVLLGGAVLLLLRDQRGRVRHATATPPVPGGTPVTTSVPEAPTSTTAPLPPIPPAAPAFAPHGPFVPPPPAPPPAPYAPIPPRPRPPKPPRSALGGLTFSLVVLVIGVLSLIDVAGFDVPVPVYFAAALTVVGLGLVVGTWIGRARGLIAVGILTAIGLGVVTGAGYVPGPGGWHGGTNTFKPTTLAQVSDSYGQDVGNLRVDLSEVDFGTGSGTRNVRVRVDWGNATILVPPNVDVVVDAAVEVGNADVFGQKWNGLGLDSRTVTDYGDDGQGGPQLHITAMVDLGNLEVKR